MPDMQKRVPWIDPDPSKLLLISVNGSAPEWGWFRFGRFVTFHGDPLPNGEITWAYANNDEDNDGN